MTDFNYKKYSLEKLEEWIHDCLSSGEATAEEVYETIKSVVKEIQEYHQKNEKVASDLLLMMNGNRPIEFNFDNMNYCSFGNTSDYCNNAWNDFWETDPAGNYVSSLSDDVILSDSSPKKWVLPVEMDGPSGEYFISFPDDLLEAAKLQEGDEVYWVDNGDGSYLMRKVTKSLKMDEC